MKLVKIALLMVVLAGVGMGAIVFWPVGRTEQEGPAAVIDAGLLEIAGTRYRLAGIVPPLPAQHCVDRKGITWACGQEAADGLRKLVNGTSVLCRPRPDNDDLSDCFVSGKSLSERMVWEGWALACRYGNADFRNSEKTPQFMGEGLWRGGFEPPTPIDKCAR